LQEGLAFAGMTKKNLTALNPKFYIKDYMEPFKSDHFSHTFDSNCLIVQLKEQFDEENSTFIKEDILKLLQEKSQNLLLDLNPVKVIRSSGLRVILSLAKDFDKKTEKFAVLYSKNDDNYQVSKILEVSGFTKIISIYETKTEALKTLS